MTDEPAAIRYVRKPGYGRSWHVIRELPYSLCGRKFTGTFETAAELPVNQRSCERCLQLQEQQ